jgi:hypothetical protein
LKKDTLYILFSLIALFISGQLAYAQQEVDVRSFNKERLESFRNEKAFAYIEDEPTDAIGDLWNWVKNLFPSIDIDVPESSFWSSFWEVVWFILKYGIPLFALIMLILRVLNLRTKISIDKNIEDYSFEELTKKVTEINWDDLLNKELKQLNFNLACRFLFLKTLKQLDEKDVIKWSLHKTNRDYLKEIPKIHQERFSRLIYFFEYAWFGDFKISQSQFEGIQTQQKQFISNIR